MFLMAQVGNDVLVMGKGMMNSEVKMKRDLIQSSLTPTYHLFAFVNVIFIYRYFGACMWVWYVLMYYMVHFLGQRVELSIFTSL